MTIQGSRATAHWLESWLYVTILTVQLAIQVDIYFMAKLIHFNLAKCVDPR